MSNRFLKNKIVRLLAGSVLAAVLLLLIGGGLLFISGWQDTATFEEDAVIVLGCAVEGIEPSEQLRCRLDTALEYHRQNPSAAIIVTGGQGSNENDTEAAVMARYLIAGGVPEEQILLEDRATSTKENFEYSAEILASELPDTSSLCFITSDFHIFRSGKLAAPAGIDGITHLHAPTPAKRVLTNLFREPIVLLKMWFID